MMKRILMVGVLLTAIPLLVTTQSSPAGRWRASVLLADGAPARDLALELKADGPTVSGTIIGPPLTIREGRLEGNTVTLSLAGSNPGQQATLTGELTGNEIVFRAVGLTPEPFHFVAVRDAMANRTGSISDAAVIQQLLKQFNVPGVSIAVIQDFKVVLAVAYGVADVETGAPVTPTTMFQAASISKPVAAMASLKAVQDGRFTLDQNVNTI